MYKGPSRRFRENDPSYKLKSRRGSRSSDPFSGRYTDDGSLSESWNRLVELRRRRKNHDRRRHHRKRKSKKNVWNCYSMYTSIDRRRSCRSYPFRNLTSKGSMYLSSSSRFRPRHCYSDKSTCYRENRSTRNIFSTFMYDVLRSCRATRALTRRGWSCHVSVSFGTTETSESVTSFTDDTRPLRYDRSIGPLSP